MHKQPQQDRIAQNLIEGYLLTSSGEVDKRLAQEELGDRLVSVTQYHVYVFTVERIPQQALLQRLQWRADTHRAHEPHVAIGMLNRCAIAF
jgi:hypothetical protein